MYPFFGYDLTVHWKKYRLCLETNYLSIRIICIISGSRLWCCWSFLQIHSNAHFIFSPMHTNFIKCSFISYNPRLNYPIISSSRVYNYLQKPNKFKPLISHRTQQTKNLIYNPIIPKITYEFYITAKIHHIIHTYTYPADFNVGFVITPDSRLNFPAETSLSRSLYRKTYENPSRSFENTSPYITSSNAC